MTKRTFAESDVLIHDYVYDELMLEDGRCFAGDPKGFYIIGDKKHRWTRIPVEQAHGEAFQHPAVWRRVKTDADYGKWIDAVRSTPFPLPYQLPAGVTEIDPPNYHGGEEYVFHYPKELRVDGEDILDGIALAQRWTRDTIDRVIGTVPGACFVTWRIRPESDIRFCPDGRFSPRVYMRFDVVDRAKSDQFGVAPAQ